MERVLACYIMFIVLGQIAWQRFTGLPPLELRHALFRKK